MTGAGARILGLDIGGSKTHAVLIDGDGHRSETRGASANLASVGVVRATQVLAEIVQDAAAGDVVAVCAGAAGADTPGRRAELSGILQELLPAATITVVHDAALILAAAQLDHGIALIAGTGSVAWGRHPDGRTARAGGWGYLLGDEGSGYRAAVLAVRHALERFDRGLAPDALTLRLAADCGFPARPDLLLQHFYGEQERRYWAARSAVVFDLAAAGDQAAAAIVTASAVALAELVSTVATRLPDAGPVVLGGGLLVNQPALRAELGGLLPPGTTTVLLDRDPADGAVWLARRGLHPAA